MKMKEILKALARHFLTRECANCPYIDEPKCSKRLLSDALSAVMNKRRRSDN